MSRSRLAPGVALVRVPGIGPAVRTVDGTFLRVSTGGVPEEELVAALRDPRRPTGPAVARLLRAFDRSGYLAPTGPEGSPEPAAPSPTTPTTPTTPATSVPRPRATDVRPDGPAPAPPAALRDVRVIGDPGTAADVARALRALGADARTTGPADPAADRPSAVVLCAVPSVPPAGGTDGHPDTAHRIDHELADHLLALGIPRQYCHREGAIVWSEPPALEPGDVTAAHVRARRLAATPAHRELAAHWRGAAVEEPAPPLSVETRALLASVLAADLAEACGALPPDTALPPARRRLRRLDSATGTVTTHPVFPVPAVAPLPIPRKASA